VRTAREIRLLCSDESGERRVLPPACAAAADSMRPASSLRLAALPLLRPHMRRILSSGMHRSCEAACPAGGRAHLDELEGEEGEGCRGCEARRPRQAQQSARGGGQAQAGAAQRSEGGRGRAGARDASLPPSRGAAPQRVAESHARAPLRQEAAAAAAARCRRPPPAPAVGAASGAASARRRCRLTQRGSSLPLSAHLPPPSPSSSSLSQCSYAARVSFVVASLHHPCRTGSAARSLHHLATPSGVRLARSIEASAGAKAAAAAVARLPLASHAGRARAA
jgi:hypothetical protein